jgi:hypothetical protein
MVAVVYSPCAQLVALDFGLPPYGLTKNAANSAACCSKKCDRTKARQGAI